MPGPDEGRTEASPGAPGKELGTRRNPGQRVDHREAAIDYLGRGTTIDAWVVDVDGRPLLWAAWTAGTPRAEVQDLLGVVDSIEVGEH